MRDRRVLRRVAHGHRGARCGQQVSKRYYPGTTFIPTASYNKCLPSRELTTYFPTTIARHVTPRSDGLGSRPEGGGGGGGGRGPARRQSTMGTRLGEVLTWGTGLAGQLGLGSAVRLGSELIVSFRYLKFTSSFRYLKFTTKVPTSLAYISVSDKFGQ